MDEEDAATMNSLGGHNNHIIPRTHKIQGPEYKKDGGLRRPFQEKQRGLERNSSVELHVSAADRRLGDLCGLALADSVVAWLPKAGMVQDIRRICANLQSDTPLTPDIKGLAQREVHYAQPRTIHYVSAEVAIGECEPEPQTH